MSKLSYVFVTLIGAIPAGWALFHLITTLMNKANELSVVILSVVITLAVCMVLIVLSPFIVAIFYKDTRPRRQKKEAQDAEESSPATAAVASKDGFGDAIPDDFDEDEARASSGGDDEFADDEYEDGDYDDGEFEDDFDMDDYDDEGK